MEEKTQEEKRFARSQGGSLLFEKAGGAIGEGMEEVAEVSDPGLLSQSSPRSFPYSARHHLPQECFLAT